MRLAAALVMAQVLGCPVRAQAGSAPLDLNTAQELPNIVQPLLSAVVNISVLKHPKSEPAKGDSAKGDSAAKKTAVLPEHAFGSGFVITDDGYIVTNKHVVDGAYDVSVSFSDGAVFTADIVAVNKRPDLALLKIDAGKPLPFVKFGDSDALRVGEPVIAIGNPFGLSSSVTAGVVSALNRDVNVTMIDDFIQTDAAINHGNSGGPLFNLKGEVIGVNWAIYGTGQAQSGSAGLGFAIPANDAKWVVEEMRHFGRLRAGFVGFRVDEITPAIQSVLGLPSRAGGIVTGIVQGAPAAASGIQEGDVIVAFNGHEPRDVRALLRSLSATAPGTKVVLEVWRNGTSKPVELTVANWTDGTYDPAGPQIAPHDMTRHVAADLGLKLAAADASKRRDSLFSPGGPAVEIVDVSPNSPATDLRILPGTLILRIGSDKVASPKDVNSKLDEARTRGAKKILMLVETPDGPHWIVMPLTES